MNADPLKDITGPESLEGSGGLGPVRMVGPRNGVCSGVVVATGGGLMSTTGTRAKMSDLTGPGTIPASAVRIRYASKEEVRHKTSSRNKSSDVVGIGDRYSNFPYYDILHESPPAGASLLPIWITVKIPPGARPGRYKGTLTFGGRKAPVELTVSRWQIPDPRDWVTHAAFVQSPETLARQYKVPLWSQKHWQYEARSLRMMGELGTKDAFVTVAAKTHLGNDTGMIRFNGTKPDFGIMEKFLGLWKEHVGRPHAVIFYFWEPSYSGRRGLKKVVPVTLRSGQASTLPMYASALSEEVWKPVTDGIRARVRKLGWTDDVIIIGTCGDQRPPQKVVAFFKRIAPYARWAIWTHGAGDPPPPANGPLVLDGVAIGHYEHPYCPKLPGGEKFLVAGWNSPWKAAINPRKYIFQYSPLTQFRNLAQGTAVHVAESHKNRLLKHSGQGFTRIGFDYWEVDGKRPILNKWSHGNWRNMYRFCPRSVTHPGPDGALSTARYEMLREGLQETEARTLIEKAVARGKVSGTRAQACRALLAERSKALGKNGGFSSSHAERGQTLTSRIWGIPDEWQASTARLFDLAGDVARATGVAEIRAVGPAPESSAPETAQRRDPEKARRGPSDELRSKVIADVESGARPRIGISMGGRSVSAEVTGASPRGITLRTGGMEIVYPWDRMPEDMVESLRKRYPGRE